MKEAPQDGQSPPVDPFASSLPTGFRFEADSGVGKRQPSDRITQTGRQRPVEIELPFKIGDYTLTERLGVGAMGAVYRARQASLDRDVALKVLAAHLTEDPDLVKRFHYEARAAAKIIHPNVVQAYGTDVGEGWHYIAMEFVDGPSVSSLMEAGGPLDEELALRIVRDVAAGIQAIADNGMVHRDVKPQNILMAPGKVAKLSDLGLVKHLGNDLSGARTQTGIVMGTPHYMAPEQAMGQQIDMRADIYALGVSLYRMLTGQFPFDGDNAFVILQRHCMEDIPDARLLRPTVTEGVINLIARMTVRDPAGRYGASQPLINDVSALLGEGGPIPGPPAPAGPMPPPQMPQPHATPGPQPHATPGPQAPAPVHPTPGSHTPVHPTPGPLPPVHPTPGSSTPVHPTPAGLMVPPQLREGPQVIQPVDGRPDLEPKRKPRPRQRRGPGAGGGARRGPPSSGTLAARRSPASGSTAARRVPSGRKPAPPKPPPKAPARRPTQSRKAERAPGRGGPIVMLLLLAIAGIGITLAIVDPKTGPVVDSPEWHKAEGLKAIVRGRIGDVRRHLEKLPAEAPERAALRGPMLDKIERTDWRASRAVEIAALCRAGDFDAAERALATFRWVLDSDVGKDIIAAAPDDAARAALEASFAEDRRIAGLLEATIARCRLLASKHADWNAEYPGDAKHWRGTAGEPAHALALWFAGKGPGAALANEEMLRGQLEKAKQAEKPEDRPSPQEIERFEEALATLRLLREREKARAAEEEAPAPPPGPGSGAGDDGADDDGAGDAGSGDAGSGDAPGAPAPPPDDGESG